MADEARCLRPARTCGESLLSCSFCDSLKFQICNLRLISPPAPCPLCSLGDLCVEPLRTSGILPALLSPLVCFLSEILNLKFLIRVLISSPCSLRSSVASVLLGLRMFAWCDDFHATSGRS